MTIPLLVAVWAVAATLALAAIVVIVHPLFTILTELCGTRERARFWTAYTSVITLAVPLLAVSTPGLLDGAADPAGNGPVLQRAVFYALLGIIFALLAAGRTVRKAIIQQFAMPVAAPVAQPTPGE